MTSNEIKVIHVLKLTKNIVGSFSAVQLCLSYRKLLSAQIKIHLVNLK